jgi:hypothetical protein
MAPQESTLTIRRFFTGLTEHAFHVRLGVADPALVDYLSELLVRFVHVGEVYRVRTPTGQRLHQVVDMLEEARARVGPAQREVHRHIGDFTLFWVGLFPEAVEQMRRRSPKDRLVDYRQQGKHAYRVASSIPTQHADAPNEVLEQLSSEFELCAYGLGEVRRQWESTESDDAPPLWIN